MYVVPSLQHAARVAAPGSARHVSTKLLPSVETSEGIFQERNPPVSPVFSPVFSLEFLLKMFSCRLLRRISLPNPFRGILLFCEKYGNNHSYCSGGRGMLLPCFSCPYLARFLCGKRSFFAGFLGAPRQVGRRVSQGP